MIQLYHLGPVEAQYSTCGALLGQELQRMVAWLLGGGSVVERSHHVDEVCRAGGTRL